MILKCNCEHEFQNKRYGYGNRVMNTDKDKKVVICTVCETKHSIGGGDSSIKDNKNQNKNK